MMDNSLIYCRTCGVFNPPNRIELKGMYQQENWSRIFFECTGIDIHQDVFSKILCGPCKNLLITAFDFRVMTKNTFEKLVRQDQEIFDIKQEIEVHFIPIVDSEIELQEHEIKEEVLDEGTSNIKLEGRILEPEDVQSDSNQSDGVDDKHKEGSKKRLQSKKKNERIKRSGVQCPGCRIVLRLNKDLKKHLKEKLGSLDHIWHCEVCSTDFKRKYELYGHILRVHKENSCIICKETHRGSNNLQRHITKFHYSEEERQTICPHCGKLIKNIRSHIRNVHKKVKNFICDQCKKKFFTKRSLIEHFRVHTNERPYQCNIPGCDKSFKQIGQLQQHIDRHGPKQDFICDVCGLNLSSKYSLINHRKTHFQIGSFKCDECNGTFTYAANLKKHKQDQHTPRKEPIICSICDQSFKNLRTLKNHNKRKHK